MAIRFVSVEPAADAPAPPEEAAALPAQPASRDESRPATKPRSRRAKAHDTALPSQEHEQAPPDRDGEPAPPGEPAALPGFEAPSQPKTRRRGPPPYWGFG